MLLMHNKYLNQLHLNENHVVQELNAQFQNFLHM